MEKASTPTYTADASGGATCNVLITFNANGSITTTNPNAAVSYDGGLDDNLVGIVNNTGSAISSVHLSSAVDDIFGFDEDGICTVYGGGNYSFSSGGTGGSGACSGASQGSSEGYAPAGVTFSGINGADTAGTVNFAGGIGANGGTAFFSLEGPVDLNLQVNSAVPEPKQSSAVRYRSFGSGCIYSSETFRLVSLAAPFRIKSPAPRFEVRGYLFDVPKRRCRPRIAMLKLSPAANNPRHHHPKPCCPVSEKRYANALSS